MQYPLNLLILGYAIQFIVIVVIIVFSIYYEVNFRKESRTKNRVKILLDEMLKNQIPTYEIPPVFLQAKVIIPILEEFDQRIKSSMWSYLKNDIIHRQLRKELDSLVTSRSWYRRCLGLRGLNLSPNKDAEEIYKVNLSHKNFMVKSLAIRGAIAIHSFNLLEALVESAINANEIFRVIYIDILIQSDHFVWERLEAIYRRKPHLRSFLKEVFIKRTGYLSDEEVTELLSVENPEELYSNIRICINHPTETGINKLQEIVCSELIPIKIRALYILGKLRVPCIDIYKQHMEHEQFQIALLAAWGMCSHDSSLIKESLKSYIDKFAYTELEIHFKNLTNSLTLESQELVLRSPDQ